MAFTTSEVTLLLGIARDASLGGTFSERLESITEMLSKLIPHSALSAIVLDLERRPETPVGQIYYKNGRPEDLVPYTANYIHDDPMAHAIPRADGRSYLLSDFVPRARFGRDAFTADFLKQINVRHIMGCSHRMPSGQLLSLAIHREKGFADFSAKEREVLRLASPDIVSAAWGALLRERMAELSTASDGSARPGAIVFSPDGEVAHSDEVGVRLAQALADNRRRGQAWLKGEVVELAARPWNEGTTRDHTVRLADGRWLRVRLSTLRAGPDASVLAILELLPPGSAELMSTIMDRAQLTPREREVATLATQAHGNREIARRLEIGEATVNTHLQRVYVKLAVQGRAELAMLLHTGARWQER